MNHERQGLLAIGSFARAARLSLKALRLYDQLGIITPHYIDPDSGYRYYHADQLHQARLIRMLRQMDMPLATIRRVLAVTPANAELLVRDYVAVMVRRVEQARRMVPELVAYLHQEEIMAFEVNVRTVEQQPVVSISRNVKVDQLDNHIRGSLETLYVLIERQGSQPTGAPFGIYHGPVNNDDDGPIEVCVPVGQTLQPEGDAQVRELPGGKIAYVVLEGEQCNFPAILQGYDAVYDWIRANGYEPDGPPRETWLMRPGEPEHMEVAWLLRE